MKKQRRIQIILIITLSLSGFSSQLSAQAPAPVGPVPSERQVEWYHREIMAFFHFGMNTFCDMVNEGDGRAGTYLFNPTALDCNQWMKVLKSGGIPCGIIVAKHADGFCNWPSDYSDYSVKNSPWKNGKGDVVREYLDACKAAGIKAGIYVGPHDRHERLSPLYNTKDYSIHYASQLSELMRNYGTVWETWWDGAGADELTTPLYTRWADTVRTLQPKCVIFGTKNSYRFADCRWVGNESGFSGDPCWSTIDSLSIKEESDHITELNQGQVNGNAYIPAEVDVSIRPSWFYHKEEDGHTKTVKELWDIYCNSVGRNSVLLLNLAPDRRGLIPSDDSTNVAGLHSMITNSFKSNFAKGAKITALHTRGRNYNPSNLVDGNENTYFATKDKFKSDTITFKLDSRKVFDCLMLQEVIQLGHRTTGWSVDYSNNGKTWTPISEASNKQSIGYKWIVRFAPISASYVRLRITDGKACIALHSFGIYKQAKL
ncbi:MAG: alpha-L-fucosidase [Paludibacter sp.]|nr:alpha-L-fucosidase [Paludibacter sp.]